MTFHLHYYNNYYGYSNWNPTQVFVAVSCSLHAGADPETRGGGITEWEKNHSFQLSLVVDNLKEAEFSPKFRLPLTPLSLPPTPQKELAIFTLLNPPSLNEIQIDLHLYIAVL